MITTLTNILLGTLVLLKSKKRQSAKLIFALSLLISAWTISNYYYNKNIPFNYSLLTNRLVFTFTAPLISVLGHLASTFPTEKKLKHVQLAIIYIPTILFVPLSLSSAIVQTVVFANGEYRPVFNNASILFAISVVFIVVFSIISFIKNYKSTTGLEKTQMQYFIFGLSATAVLATISNLILPMGFGIFSFTNLGPTFSLIFIFTTTYSILKYRLFDIRFVLGKLIYYTLIAVPPYAAFFVFAFLFEALFDTSIYQLAFLLGIPIAYGFAFFTLRLTEFFQKYTDTHLINPGYDPLKVKDDLRKKISNLLNIQELSHYSLETIAKTIRPLQLGLIIYPKNSKPYSLEYKSNKPLKDLKQFSEVYEILKAEISKTRKNSFLYYYESKENESIAVYKLMKERKIRIIYPISNKLHIQGLLLIGNKESNAEYNDQETDLLNGIVEIMSSAIYKAILYEEIQEFNIDLQKKVETATSELQSKNQDLEEAITNLEDVRRQEKDMLDVMGHELRTPISIARNAVITINKEITKPEDEQKPEKVSKYTNMAIEATRREIGLIETFLSTTKLEGDRMQFNFEQINLKDVIDESMEGLKDAIGKADVIIHTDESTNDIFVKSDKIRIQEVMDNFLSNAIKYTQEGEVWIHSYVEDGFGRVDVKDNGIGISEENLQKLGKKFFRAQTLFNKSGKVVNPSGTGLGLFVTFQLIDLMGGKRWIESKEGEGSTFSFAFELMER